MTSSDYQKATAPLLQEKLPELEVVKEWIAFRGFSNHYSPRVDIAVGPFSIEPYENQTWRYNQLIETEAPKNLLRTFYNIHRNNIREELENEIRLLPFDELITKNQNARCFLAIEIENKNSKKHFMGSLINAASLGRVGIGIAYSEDAMRTFIRIMNYLGFLKRVEKNTYDTGNFLLLTREQFSEYLGFNEPK